MIVDNKREAEIAVTSYRCGQLDLIHTMKLFMLEQFAGDDGTGHLDMVYDKLEQVRKDIEGEVDSRFASTETTNAFWTLVDNDGVTPV